MSLISRGLTPPVWQAISGSGPKAHRAATAEIYRLQWQSLAHIRPRYNGRGLISNLLALGVVAGINDPGVAQRERPKVLLTATHRSENEK